MTEKPKPFDNHNRKLARALQGMINEIANEISYEMAYFMSWKVRKPISFTWSENTKYILFIADKFNTNDLTYYSTIPEGYKIGKIVVRPAAGSKSVHVEVNFVKIEDTEDRLLLAIETLDLIAIQYPELKNSIDERMQIIANRDMFHNKARTEDTKFYPNEQIETEDENK